MLKKILTGAILLGLLAVGSLIADDRVVAIDLTVYIANAHSSGNVRVYQTDFGGETEEVGSGTFVYGDTEVHPRTPHQPYLLVHGPGEYYHQLLDVWSLSQEQGWYRTAVYLDLPDQTVYETYHLLYNHDIPRTIDLEEYIITGPGSSFNLHVYPDQRYFQLTGDMELELSGTNHGEPEQYGIKYHILNSYAGISRNIIIKPCTEFDEVTSYSLPLHPDCAPPDDPFLYYSTSGNTITYIGLVYPPGGPGDVNIINTDRELIFEYVPDYSSPFFSISIESFELSPDEWHPKLEWTYNGFGSFFTANPFWANLFETQIWRKKVPTAGSGNWTFIASIDPEENTFIDEEIESPAQGGGGLFGIEGRAYYKILLAQKPNNPNYDLSGDGVDNEFDFDYSSTKSIYYGHNSSGWKTAACAYYRIENITVFNYSNPNISFRIRDNSMVNTRIKIYNLKGQLVKNLLDSPLRAGKHTVTWNGKDNSCTNVTNGIYLLQISRGNMKTAKKITLLR